MTEQARDRYHLARTAFRIGVRLFWVLVAIMVLLVSLDWLLRTELYPVRRVSYEGAFKHVAQKQLEAATVPLLRGNYLTVNLGQVKQQVEALAWVERAWVSRRWPNTIHVRFTEQRFVARWGKGAWLNGHGEVVRLPVVDGPTDVVRLAGPAGSSTDVWQRYLKMNKILKAISMRITELELTPRRMWRLRLDNGVVLVAGRDKPAEKVKRFVRAYPHLAKRMAEVRRIDLRYANGFAVEWASKADGLVRPVNSVSR